MVTSSRAIPFLDHEEHCDRRTTIVASELRRHYRALNPSRHLVAKYRIDGRKGFVKIGKRCDFLFLNIERNNAYFIELKGNHIADAAEQIYETIMVLKRELPSLYVCHARIVVSRVKVHDLRSLAYIRLERLIYGNKGTILKKSIVLEERIS